MGTFQYFAIGISELSPTIMPALIPIALISVLIVLSGAWVSSDGLSLFLKALGIGIIIACFIFSVFQSYITKSYLPKHVNEYSIELEDNEHLAKVVRKGDKPFDTDVSVKKDGKTMHVKADTKAKTIAVEPYKTRNKRADYQRLIILTDDEYNEVKVGELVIIKDDDSAIICTHKKATI